MNDIKFVLCQELKVVNFVKLSSSQLHYKHLVFPAICYSDISKNY